MKKVFLIFAIALTTYAASAQARRSNSGTTNFSIGVEAGVPVGQFPKGFQNPYSFIVGASLQVESHVASDLGLTGSLGYLSYSYKTNYQNNSNGGGSTGFVPLMGGVKYYFSPSVFGHAQLGAAFGTSSGQGTSFAYSPGIGFNISRNIDAEIKYLGISNSAATLGSVGVRLAYNF